MNSKTFWTGYRSTSSQVEEKKKTKKPQPPTCFLTQLLVKHSQKQHKVVSGSVKVPHDNHWIVDNNAATARLVQRLDSDSNPTQLLQHTNRRQFGVQHLHTCTSSNFRQASGCEQATKRRLSTWQGVKLKNTIKKTKKQKTEDRSVQRKVSHIHWTPLIPDTWRWHRDDGNE